MRLLIATSNKKKWEELRSILGNSFEIVSLRDLGADFPEVEEDTGTFAGNAIKKAVYFAHWTGFLTVADDSGLEVEALCGKPGVYSARFAGPQKDDRENNKKLLALMQNKRHRRACFTCFVAVADKAGLIGLVSGRIWGDIAETMKGSDGFGYDPVFIPKGFEKTFAQLGREIKNSISHRKVALEKARQLLKIYKIS